MSDKKHIDRIFQEKLKELDATPDKAVWDKIQKELNGEKKNRKVIPLWWKLAGVAAGLILLLTLGNFIFNNSDSTNNIPVVVESDKSKDEEGETSITEFDKEKFNKTSEESISETSKNSNPIIQSKDGTTNKSIVNNKTKEKQDKGNFNNEIISSNKVANQGSAIAEPPNNISSVTKNESSNSGDNTNLTSEKNNQKRSAADESLVITNDNDKTTKNKTSKDITNNTSEDPLVVDQEKEKIPLTEEVIASNEDINEKETINRWQIYPNVAPVYFNSLGKGSSLDEQFNNNPKTGELNTSYGVNVGYAINDKITLKTGFNALALSYDTDNVILYQNIGASQSLLARFRNIKVDNSEITMISASSVSAQQVNSILGASSKAAISQRLDYFEIPLEVDYKLINKKMGVNLTGGFSTFFLRNNEVVSEFDGYSTYIGEATNINGISYSLNFGLGFNFPLSKKMSFNIDPKFKYQINTFNDTSGNFRPYIIGLYTGLNYKF